MCPEDLPTPVIFRTRKDGQEIIIVQVVASQRTETSGGGFGGLMGVGARFKTITETHYSNAVLATMQQAGSVEEARAKIATITGAALDTIFVLDQAASQLTRYPETSYCQSCKRPMQFSFKFCPHCGAASKSDFVGPGGTTVDVSPGKT